MKKDKNIEILETMMKERVDDIKTLNFYMYNNKFPEVIKSACFCQLNKRANEVIDILNILLRDLGYDE